MNSISEDQKRWLVVGIAFNKLVPQIRPFVEQSLQTEYQRLKSSNNIHIQTAPGPILKKHPKNLKYENINSNSNHKVHPGKFDFSKFDYKVTSHVDFAKLYVQPFMAKFTAFDGKCDGSAVLLLLGEVPVFPPVVQAAAKSVKDNVRNEWAHCNFTDWDAAKFQSSFQEMRQLVQSIGLPTADEANLVSELNDWETKGVAFCGNSPVDHSLLGLLQNEVSQLSSNVDNFVCQYKEQKDALESQFLEFKKCLDQLPELSQKFEQMEQEVEALKQQVAELSCKPERAEESVKPATFFGVLDRNKYFTGREKEMGSLEKAFEERSVSPGVSELARDKVKVLGICGLGGCGKSSLSFEYAWRNIERYPGGVFVVNGESDELMRASLLDIYREFVDRIETNQSEVESEQLLNETFSWFCNLREKWLLLVDNMDQKELSPLARKLFFGQWKAKTKMAGGILVTSRRRLQALCEDLRITAENCLELSPLSVHESVMFLRRRIGTLSICDDQEQGEKELAQELGGLPLALEQAAAYIKELECSIQLYVQQYRSHKTSLLSSKSATPLTEVYNEERLAVETTWLLNFSYVTDNKKDRGLGKAAAFVMKVAAYLSPDEIPIDVVNIGAPEVEHEDMKKRLEMPIGTKQIVDLLVRFSLFKQKSDDTLSVHRLVQETLRELCDREGETDDVLSSATRMIHQAFLNCVGGTDFLRVVHKSLASQTCMKQSCIQLMTHLYTTSCETTLECRRWQNLCVNAFHLVRNLLRDSPLKPRFICEESARLFCEAAFYCYLAGMESQGYKLQQFVLDILSAIKEPIRCYKDDELQTLTRILIPFLDAALISKKLVESTDVKEVTEERGSVPVDTNRADELSQSISLKAPKAKEAFVRDDFGTSADLYTEIINLSKFSIDPGTLQKTNLHLVSRSLGEVFCHRGIARLKMEKFEAAVDDFNASICLDSQCYRSYYWKAYTFCKLSEMGRAEFVPSAQAAASVLHFKFGSSKSKDVQKLWEYFPRLLYRSEYKSISQVSDLKGLERVYDAPDQYSLTVILAEGQYRLNEIKILGGRYYFVCPPGGSAVILCAKGLYLSRGSFLFENVYFTCPEATSEKDKEEVHAAENSDTVTLGGKQSEELRVPVRTEQNGYALIEANDVHSLVICHCVISGATRSGIVVKSNDIFRAQKGSVRMTSSIITCCEGTGLELQGRSFCHCTVQGSIFKRNLYGVVIDCPSQFLLTDNVIAVNDLSGVLAIGAEGRLLKNSLICNGMHGILFNSATAAMVENLISQNCAWGIVCLCESSLQCKENVLNSNFCGGLNLMLNGKGNVLVEKCELKERFGPAVFPVSTSEIRQVDAKLKPFLRAPRTKTYVSFYVMGFMESTRQCWARPLEPNYPDLLDNRESGVSVMLQQIDPNVCSACYKDLRVADESRIECPKCLVARYCCKKCFDAAKAGHNVVCESILEANKISMDCYEFRKPRNSTSQLNRAAIQRRGLSLCVVTVLTYCLPLEPPTDPRSSDSWRHTSTPSDLCLIASPQENLWGYFFCGTLRRVIVTNGYHLRDYMMHMKAACVLANFDPESKKITVYHHRIFPLEKHLDALSCIDSTLCLAWKHMRRPR